MSSACLFPIRIERPANGGRRLSCPEEASARSGVCIWVAMITSAENRPWPDDIPFGESYPEANLPAPSIVRPCKLATIEGGDAEKIGRVNAEMMEEVVAFLRRAMLGG